MQKDSFRFKRFSIRQRESAMKVGTDGVLLGAWATVLPTDRRILDIGTGTGLIALMAAQRSSADTLIVGAEIDPAAAGEARYNAENSPWRARVRIFHGAIQGFLDGGGTLYDRILSNPPFFSRSLPSPSGGRTLARHDESLPADELFAAAGRLLAPEGTFSLIVPADALEKISLAAGSHGLGLCRMRKVRGTPESPVKRVMAEFSRGAACSDEEPELIIETGGRHGYSSEYRELTRDFYLKF